MKKIFFLLITLLILTGLLGCGGNTNVGDNTNIIEIGDDQIYDILVDAYPYRNNLKVITQKPFRNKLLILISYDEGNIRFEEIEFIENKKGGIVVSGGGGGIATPSPFTFSSMGAYSDEDSYFITSGTIFDEQIKEIRVEYSDGKIISEKIKDDGYAIIREEKVDFVRKIEGLDENGQVIDSLGETGPGIELDPVIGDEKATPSS